MRKLIYLLALGLVLTACNGKTDKNPPPKFDTSGRTDEPQKFKPYEVTDSSKIERTQSGLGIYMVQEGPGDKPQIGANVIVNYHGMLEDGTVFDSSYDRGQPFNFPLGQGRVIQGWDEGIAKLRFGSKAILFVPSDLGYGERGSPPNIPPNTPLIFHVELLGSF